MANKKSAIKRIRQTERKNKRNSDIRSACRTAEKSVRSLAGEGKKDLAIQALSVAEKKLSRAAAKNLYHKNNASRRISRLTKLVNSL